MVRGWAPLTALTGWILAVPLSTALADDLADYGAYLSSACVTCHRAGASDNRIPSLAGRSREDILTALAAFKSGARASPVMQDIAAHLADDEMVALATHYSSLAASTLCGEAPSPQDKKC